MDITPKRIIQIVVGVIAGIFALSIVFGSWYTIDEGHIGIVKVFGEAKEQVTPGLHFKMPFIEDIVEMEVRTRRSNEDLRAATAEQMPITASVSVNWTPERLSALQLYKEYGDLAQFENRILDPRLRSAAKEAISKFNAEQLIQNRGAVISKIESIFFATISALPLSANSVQLENIEMPSTYIESIKNKQIAKNQAAEEKHKLEKQNLQAQQKVNTANAERDSIKALADAEAYKTAVEAKALADARAYNTKVTATANAEAIKLKGVAEASAIQAKADALKANAALVEYVKWSNWNGQLPTTMMGDGQNVLWNFK